MLLVIKKHRDPKAKKTRKPTRASSSRPDLVHHHLRLSLVSGLGGRLVLLLGVIAHLDVVITTGGLIFIQIVLVIVTLLLQILALGTGVFLVLLASGLLATGHLLVFALGLSLALFVGVFELLDKGGFELGFLLAIGIAVIVQTVGLRLIRRILGGGGFLRIPRGPLANIEKYARLSPFSYHLMAKRVTRGFSARTLRRIRSMTGCFGGSAVNSSESYSLLT